MCCVYWVLACAQIRTARWASGSIQRLDACKVNVNPVGLLWVRGVARRPTNTAVNSG